MMNTLAVGNFRAVQVGTRMGSRVVQSEIKDVSYPGGDSVRVYVECHKDIYPDYSSLRVHMLTGGSKDDIHYMLDDRGSSTIAIQQSLTGTNRWIADSTHAPPDAADVADAGGAQQAASSSPTPPLLATTRRTERYVFNQKRLQSLQWSSSKLSRKQASHHVHQLLYLLPHLDDLVIEANGSVSAAYVLLAELCAKPLRVPPPQVCTHLNSDRLKYACNVENGTYVAGVIFEGYEEIEHVLLPNFFAKEASFFDDLFVAWNAAVVGIDLPPMINADNASSVLPLVVSTLWKSSMWLLQAMSRLVKITRTLPACLPGLFNLVLDIIAHHMSSVRYRRLDGGKRQPCWTRLQGRADGWVRCNRVLSARVWPRIHDRAAASRQHVQAGHHREAVRQNHCRDP